MAEQTEDTFRTTDLCSSVQVHLPEGRVIEGPRGSQAGSFLACLEDVPAPVVGAIVNGELRELTYPIELEARLRPVTMGEADGMRIYRRSLTFLLAAAFEDIFPGEHLNVDHSISSGGYYCQVRERAPLSIAELERLEGRMWELVEQDLPFAKIHLPLEDASQYFAERGYADKVLLLKHRKKPQLVLYALPGFRDYHHGYMVPSTGYLQWFALAGSVSGFTLRFPRRHNPTTLLPLPTFPGLLSTFRRYGDWLETMGVSNVGELNEAIVAGRGQEIILVSEALHERRIAEIAGKIAEQRKDVRLVLIAGPSSSGKTTFSKRLSIQLLALGLSPFPVEMDGFFVDREKTPRDEAGEYDFERLEALDLQRLNHDLGLLIAGQRVRLPHYDFIAGKQIDGGETRLSGDQIIILEGIHGLNPDLLPSIPADRSFRIYASALTQLNLDRYNRVSTTDTRLIRRIVRDAAKRGYSAAETIKRWESVRRGEKRYIFPFQENADMMFNSALPYEGAALASLAEPLLRQVPFATAEHVEAKRLLTFLDWFLPIETSAIPDNSILREFLGGSILDGFAPWQRPETGG